MNQEAVWSEFAALPPEAQRQVMDFIAFLRSRYVLVGKPEPSPETDIASEEFIGIWQDREDMQDSTAWVRNLREHEWERRHD
jgi:hypothetical protein